MINYKKFPYKNIREEQMNILEWVDRNWNDKRYIVIEAGTGIGKSALAKTIASSSSQTFLLTATKQLQDQYIKDFKGNDFISIKGRANYTCNENKRLNCECGPCMLDKNILRKCKALNRCVYFNIRKKAQEANTALTSYQYFLYSTTCGKFWTPRETIILDEAHLTESQLVQWATININPDELKSEYDLDFPKYTQKESLKENIVWLEQVWKAITNKRLNVQKEILEAYKQTPSIITAELSGYDITNFDFDLLTEEDLEEILSVHSEYYKLDKLYRRFCIFFESADKHNNWICEANENCVVLTPITAKNLFRKYIDSMATKRIIFLSATILNIKGLCNDLDISKDQLAAVRCESNFNSEKSPIYYMPSGSTNYKNLDSSLPIIIKNINNIINNYENEKGIIHTGNYKIAKAIYDNIKSDRFIMKTDNQTNEELIKIHENSIKSTILLSPSLTTGADLKDDLSRFQIIVKLPWMSLADTRIKERIKIDEDWYLTEMMRTLVQAAGRSTRSENDWSHTYVLDNSFIYWINKAKKWLPKKFMQRINTKL